MLASSPNTRPPRRPRIRNSISGPLLLFGLLASACGDSGGDGSGSADVTGGTTTSGDGGDTYVPPLACDPIPCEDPSDCCNSNHPGPGLIQYACSGPDAVFPNAWSCVEAVDGGSEICVQQAGPTEPEGCDPAGSDDDQCRVPGFQCLEIYGVGHCVMPCAVHAVCLSAGLGACRTVDGVQFCAQ